MSGPADLARVEAVGHVKRPILQAIREKCIDCSGGSLAEVRWCPVTKCALGPIALAPTPLPDQGDEAPLKKTAQFGQSFRTAGPSEGRGEGDRRRRPEGQCHRARNRRAANQPTHQDCRTICGSDDRDSESPAFRVLSLSARRVLDRLEIELAPTVARTTASCW